MMTRDVLGFALVTSDSFPAKSTSVLFWSKQCELCKFCLTQCRVEQLLLSTACTVREMSGTPGACCFFLCCQFNLVTRLRVLDLIHGAHHGSSKSHVFISSHNFHSSFFFSFFFSSPFFPSFFIFSFVFLFFMFCMFALVILPFFLSSEQTPKPAKNRREVPVVRKDHFLL